MGAWAWLQSIPWKSCPASDIDLAMHLHEQAHHECFIANSVNFPVTCEAVITCATP